MVRCDIGGWGLLMGIAGMEGGMGIGIGQEQEQEGRSPEFEARFGLWI